MDMESTVGLMEELIMDNGWMAICMLKASCNGQMEKCIKESFVLIRDKDSELWLFKMEMFIKEDGVIINKVEEEKLYIKMTQLKMECGIKEKYWPILNEIIDIYNYYIYIIYHISDASLKLSTYFTMSTCYTVLFYTKWISFSAFSTWNINYLLTHNLLSIFIKLLQSSLLKIKASKSLGFIIW